MIACQMQKIQIWVGNKWTGTTLLGFLLRSCPPKLLIIQFLLLVRRYYFPHNDFFKFFALILRYLLLTVESRLSFHMLTSPFICFRMASTIYMIWRLHSLHFLLNLFKHLSMSHPLPLPLMAHISSSNYLTFNKFTASLVVGNSFLHNILNSN